MFAVLKDDDVGVMDERRGGGDRQTKEISWNAEKASLVLLREQAVRFN